MKGGGKEERNLSYWRDLRGTNRTGMKSSITEKKGRREIPGFGDKKGKKCNRLLERKVPSYWEEGKKAGNVAKESKRETTPSLL